MRSNGSTGTQNCTRWPPTLTGEVCVCVCVCVCHSGCVCPTEKQYGRAREHFLHAEQPQEFGNMLVELSATFGYAGEADLFVTQAVLQ